MAMSGGDVAKKLDDVIRRHGAQARLLAKILDDTRRVFRDAKTASCVSDNNVIVHELTLTDEALIDCITKKPPALIVFSQLTSACATVANQVFETNIFPLPHENSKWNTVFVCDPENVGSTNVIDRCVKTTSVHWPLTDNKQSEVNDQSNVIQGHRSYSCDASNMQQLDGALCNSSLPVKLLVKHPLLHVGMIMIVCGDNLMETYQLCVRDMIPIIVYVVSGDHLTEKDVEILQHIRQENDVSILFVRIASRQSAVQVAENQSIVGNGNTCCVLRHELSRLRLISSSQPVDELELLQSELALGDSLSESGDEMSDCCIVANELCEEIGGHFVERVATFMRSLLQKRMLTAVELLYGIHWRCLDTMIATTFDAASDVVCAPARIVFIREREAALYKELVAVAEKKQSEIKKIIVEAIASEKEFVLQMASEHQFIDESGSQHPLDVRECIAQIHRLVLGHLNSVVATRLLGLVDGLRSSCLEVLVRCLESVERKTKDNWESQDTSVALQELLRATYNVELTVFTRQSTMRTLLERMRQLMYNILRHSSQHLDGDWKRSVAASILAAFTNARCKRITKDICCQIEDRLRQAHTSFERSLRRLESRHDGLLRQTEANSLSLRKTLAPRIARLALESRSLRDLILHGKPVLGPELGHGQYGTVYACESWAGFEKCAVKSVAPPDDKHFNDLALEFHYTTNIPEHERIVSLRGSVIDYKFAAETRRRFPAVLLIMDRFMYDLHTAIQRSMAWLSRLQVAIDVAEGIRYLHSLGLVHRDIKLNNVLLDSNYRGKLADFGFCKPAAMMSGSVVGTPLHMAPELMSARYDRSVDVYAFGMMFWFVCSGTVQYPKNFQGCNSVDHFFDRVKHGLRPERPLECDDECWELMNRCWNADAAARPHIGELEQSLRIIYKRFSQTPSASECSVAGDATEYTEGPVTFASFYDSYTF